jgi:hypothetical protein
MPESPTYKIIGGNGIEYGPVTADQIRQWIAEGRASGQTLAQPEGTPGWKPISAFPEFAGVSSVVPPALGATTTDEAGRKRAKTLLLGPVIGLIITGASSFVFTALQWTVFRQIQSGRDFSKGPFMTPEVWAEIKKQADHYDWRLFALVMTVSLFAIIAGMQMRRMKGFGFCVFASIATLAIIPFGNICVCVGSPVAIWALVVLFQPAVKAFFK